MESEEEELNLDEMNSVQTFKALVEEECTGVNDIVYSLTEDGFQKVEILSEDKTPWFSVELGTQYLTELDEEEDFEEVAEMAIQMLIDFIEKEVARQVDSLAQLN